MTVNEEFKTLVKAVNNNDLITVKELLDAGFDLESIDEYGEPILSDIVFNLLEELKPHRYEIVKSLIELGFNPNHLDAEGSGPLTQAMLSMDAEMIVVLLEAGAKPNETAGFKEGEKIYDWAVFDYVYQIWGGNKYPEQPDENALLSEDLWLQWIDGIAIKHQCRRPDYLFALREYGARTGVELSIYIDDFVITQSYF